MARIAGVLGGLIVPVLTPLTSDEDLDVPALEGHLDFLIDSGSDALFILGSNGEGATLRARTRLAMIEQTLRIVAGRLPVICGVLEVSTSRIVEQTTSLRGIGLAGYVATTPLYFDGFSESGLVDHFTAIAESADAPLLLYNIPQFVGVTLSEALIRRLADVDNIAGLKDSSGNWTTFQSLVLDRPSKPFSLLQGFHSLSAVSLIAGADGLVPGYANLYPDLFVRLIQAVGAQDVRGALSLQRQMDRLLSFRGPANLHANKVLAKALGLMDDHVTSPLPRLDDATARLLIERSVAAGLPVAQRNAVTALSRDDV